MLGNQSVQTKSKVLEFTEVVFAMKEVTKTSLGNLPICEVYDHRSKTNISTHFKTVHKITKKLKKDIELLYYYLIKSY